MKDEDCFLCKGAMKIDHRIGRIDCPDPDEVHRKLRKRLRFPRPPSLTARVLTSTSNGESTYELEFEFKRADAEGVVKALRQAADDIEECWF